MKRITIIASIFLGFSTSVAAEFDGSDPLLCSAVSVSECVPGGSCEQVANTDINAPDFFRIDVRKKSITGTAGGTDRPTNKIDSSGVLGSSLFLQGKASGLEHLPEDALAWSASINTVTGAMVFTVSGDGVAFVIFGSCIAP